MKGEVGKSGELNMNFISDKKKHEFYNPTTISWYVRDG